MALTIEQIELEIRRKELILKIEDLKTEARAIKKQYDELTRKLQLQHQFGNLSEADKKLLM